jgi:hypothetical protein
MLESIQTLDTNVQDGAHNVNCVSKWDQKNAMFLPRKTNSQLGNVHTA